MRSLPHTPCQHHNPTPIIFGITVFCQSSPAWKCSLSGFYFFKDNQFCILASKSPLGPSWPKDKSPTEKYGQVSTSSSFPYFFSNMSVFHHELEKGVKLFWESMGNLTADLIQNSWHGYDKNQKPRKSTSEVGRQEKTKAMDKNLTTETTHIKMLRICKRCATIVFDHFNWKKKKVLYYKHISSL